jgi:type II secretory pathway pseudopilin PulG
VEKRPQIVNRKLDNEPSSSGFTSIELIVVIIALSILAGTAVVSFRLSDQDKSTIAADQLIADIQYVQMRAMGIGTKQSVSFADGSREYIISEPTPETKRLPDNDGLIVITGTNFSSYGNALYFNTLGEPCLLASAGPPQIFTSCSTVSGGNCTINLGKGTTSYKTITVYAITGRVE